MVKDMHGVLRWVGALMMSLALGTAASAQSTDIFKGFAGGSAPIQVDAKTLEIFEEGETRISVFSGGVTVVRGNTTLKAATIKIYSDKEDGESAFNLIEATGTVYVNSGGQTVTGAKAVVDNQAETITLSGDVVLSQGKNVLVGERLVVDMATGRARVEEVPGKPVRIVITPDKKKN